MCSKAFTEKSIVCEYFRNIFTYEYSFELIQCQNITELMMNGGSVKLIAA